MEAVSPCEVIAFMSLPKSSAAVTPWRTRLASSTFAPSSTQNRVVQFLPARPLCFFAGDDLGIGA